MATKPYLSIVIPAYNESDNIKKGVLDSIHTFLKAQSYLWEVIFVDDGSSDTTREQIQAFIRGKANYRLMENKHQGKAATVTSGMLEAQGRFILFSDLDQATPLREFKKLEPFTKTHDVIIGSRSGERSGAPISRKIMARGFMIIRSLLLGLGVEDTQCGFKLFSHQAAHTLFKKLRLHKKSGSITGSRVTAGFDVELLCLAKKLGFSIKEVPVKWKYVETRRVNPIRDSWDALTDLARIKLFDIKGTYC